jgi:hypothetical protein
MERSVVSTSRWPAATNIPHHAAEYLVAGPLSREFCGGSPQPVTEACLEVLVTATRQRLNRFVFTELRLPEGSRFPDDANGWERGLRTECDRNPAFADELGSIVGLLHAVEHFAAERRCRSHEWENLLDQARLTLGEDHPASLRVADHTAGVQEREGDNVRALALCRQTWISRARVLGTSHRDTLISANNLALLHLQAGCAPKAIKLLETTLLATGSATGTGHPHTMLCAMNLAAAYDADGQDDLAGQFYAAVHAEATTTLGPGHELTMTAWSRLRSHRK